MSVGKIIKTAVYALIIIGVVVLLAYLAVMSDRYYTSGTCESFRVVIKDSTDTHFIKESDILQLVKRYNLYPVGKPLNEVNTLVIQDTILSNKLVASAEVYRTPNRAIVASVTQRHPVVRVVSNISGNFYVDEERYIMPVSSNYTVYVPLATGFINRDFAAGELYDFAIFLRNNPDWDAFIEQIEVRENGDVVLIPRIGDFKIVLGELHDFPTKLRKFVLFTEKGLSQLGWNRYSEINLKYDNQVVGVRR